MSLLTNKHVIMAMIIAPILAIISYFFVDKLVSPKASPAQSGESYPLVARSNCRYASGKCTLVNGEFKINFLQQSEQPSSQIQLSVESALPIDGIRYAFTDETGKELTSGAMQEQQISFSRERILTANSFQVAIKSGEVFYFAETQTAFILGLDSSNNANASLN